MTNAARISGLFLILHSVVSPSLAWDPYRFQKPNEGSTLPPQDVVQERLPNSQKTLVAQKNQLENKKAEASPGATRLVDHVQKNLTQVGTDREGLQIEPGRKPAHALKSIENFFKRPLEVISTSSGWANQLESCQTLTDYFALAGDIVESPLTKPESQAASSFQVSANTPPQLREPIQLLVTAISAAAPHLKEAVNSVSPEARRSFLEASDWPDQKGNMPDLLWGERTSKEAPGMASFKQGELLNAAGIITEAVDKVLPLLEKTGPVTERIKMETPAGTVLIGTSGDDTYDEGDLKGVVLLIDPGGNNTYKAPVARALENEIRVVIDRGANVQVVGKDSKHGNAGTGIFGIGIMVLPNASGNKQIETGPFSQGVGVGGVGALVVKGESHLAADRYVQGYGTFGAGILVAKDSDRTQIDTFQSGLGVGSTRGVGLFHLQGNDTMINAGLSDPDPREGATSLCLGVGYGPRAFAAGGVGGAVISGNNSKIKTSHLAGGVGYWWSLGFLKIAGNKNDILGYRYVLGSGVHQAAGHFEMKGDDNQVRYWAVGNHGWDQGIASQVVTGNNNTWQCAEWGANQAQIGSRAFSLHSGDGNKLRLVGIGYGPFFRNQPSYSLHVVEGRSQLDGVGGAVSHEGEVHRRSMVNGDVQVGKDVELVDLKMPTPEWPSPDRTEATAQQTKILQTRLSQAETKPVRERIADILSVAAAFSLDEVTPVKAFNQLAKLNAGEVKALIAGIHPGAFLQNFQRANVLPGYGQPAAKEIKEQMKSASPDTKIVMINILRMMSPSESLPVLNEMLQDKSNTPVLAATIQAVGWILNKNTVEDPGLYGALNALQAALTSPGEAQNAELNRVVSNMRHGEVVGMVVLAKPEDASRMAYFKADNAEPVNVVDNTPSSQAVLDIVKDAPDSTTNIAAEMATMQKAEATIRPLLRGLLESSDSSIVKRSIAALGQIGNADDVEAVSKFANHANPSIRATAMTALARMGPTGVAPLNQLMASDDPLKRTAVMGALLRTGSKELLPLIDKGLRDPSPQVRVAAVEAIRYIPSALKKENQPALVQSALSRLRQEKDPSVVTAIRLMELQIQQENQP